MTETKQLETATVAPEVDLEKAGFTGSATTVKTSKELARKMRVAYEWYQCIEQKDITAFDQRIQKDTLREVEKTPEHPYGGTTHDRLVLTPIANYREIPPKEVVDKVLEAKSRACFDSMEVATVESVTNYRHPDPIVFGKIEGTDKRWVVAQWDTDISVEDIIGKEDGWPTTPQ